MLHFSPRLAPLRQKSLRLLRTGSRTPIIIHLHVLYATRGYY
jgi:hypothetical protein